MAVSILMAVEDAASAKIRMKTPRFFPRKFKTHANNIILTRLDPREVIASAR
jgi:hypothetical protein